MRDKTSLQMHMTTLILQCYLLAILKNRALIFKRKIKDIVDVAMLDVKVRLVLLKFLASISCIKNVTRKSVAKLVLHLW